MDTENKALTPSNIGTTAIGGKVPMAQQELAAGMQTMSEGNLAQSPHVGRKVDHL